MEEGTIHEFSGWDDNPVEDIGDVILASVEAPTSPEPEKTEPKNENKKEKEELELEDTFKTFAEDADSTEGAPAPEETEDTDGTEATGETDNSFSLLDSLKKKGLIEFELEEGQEMTPELEDQLISKSFDTKVEESIEEIFSEMSPYLQRLNKFALAGGDPKAFVDSTASEVDPSLDLSIESNQIKILTAQLQKDGESQEEIDSQIEFYKDSGKLERLATLKYNRQLQDQEEAQSALIENQKNTKKDNAAKAAKYRSDMDNYVKGTESVLGMKLNRQEKKDLPSFMYDSTVKLKGGGTATKMQVQLHAALQNEEKALAIAKLLNSDFDFSSLTSGKEQKILRRVKDNLEGKGVKAPEPTKRTKNFAHYFNK